MPELPSQRRKLAWGAIGLFAAAVALTGLLDDPGRNYAEGAFSRALLTFALARTLDSAISVAQGTQVAVEPAGVGVNFALGEALDPLNDLVERFSVAMLVATSSLGLQNVLLRMSTWWGTNLALALSAALLLTALWRPALVGGLRHTAAIRLFLIFVFLRFAVPVFVIGTNLVFDAFLAAEHEAANQALTATSMEIEALTDEATPPIEDRSFAQRLGDSLQVLNVRERLEGLRVRVSSAVEQIINLIVIFALQTIILPLAFLWLFAGFLKALASRTTKL